MTIEQIRQFIAVVEMGSISKAAKSLFVSQPNLTTSIKKLEKELNVPLFERTQRGMLLTENGRYFYSVVNPLYRQYSELPQMFNSENQSIPLSFCVSNSYISEVSRIYNESVQKYWDRECHFVYREVNPFEVYEDVAEQRSDIGVLFSAQMTRNALLKYMNCNHVEYTKLTDCALNITCGPKNPLYQSDVDTIGVEVLTQYPVIGYDSKQQSIGLWGNSILNNLDIPRSVVVNSRSSMHALLNDTDAIKIGIVANTNSGSSHYKKLLLTDVDMGLEIGWICRSGYQHTEISRMFVDLLSERFQK